MRLKRVLEEYLRGWLPKEQNMLGNKLKHQRTFVIALTATILIVSSVSFAMLFGKPSTTGSPIKPQAIVPKLPTEAPFTSPSPSATPTLSPSPTPSPSSTPYNGYMSQPPSLDTKTVKTFYTPLPTPAPESGIVIVSITCYSIGDDYFQRSLSSRVTNVVVKNFGTINLTATSLTLYSVSPSGKNPQAGYESSLSVSVIIPANSTIDTFTHLLPTSWTGSGSVSTTFYYVVIETAEGYTAASDQFAFPVLELDR
jgi:hypothetical protein